MNGLMEYVHERGKSNEKKVRSADQLSSLTQQKKSNLALPYRYPSKKDFKRHERKLFFKHGRKWLFLHIYLLFSFPLGIVHPMTRNLKKVLTIIHL